VSLLRRKPVEQSIRDTEQPEHRLRKDLTGLDLTVFGVRVIIGTGIFVLTGVAANQTAGPAVALSFVGRYRLRSGRAVLRGVRVHRAGRGSAYTYSYDASAS
jgi:APA family basic amino acid/polyamine antiporter